MLHSRSLSALALEGRQSVTTTDGSLPTSTSGVVYSGAIAVNATKTLKAIAYKADWVDSTAASGVFTMIAATPTFGPAAGGFTASQSVTLSSLTSGASIRYTTDGSAPSPTSGTLYSSPIPVSVTTTIKAIAYLSGWSDSAVVSGTYTLTAGPPAFSPAAGTYTSGQVVTLSSTTPGAIMRYTVNGTAPTAMSGTPYTGGIAVDANTTVKAIAFMSGWSDSAVTSAAYIITGSVVAPAISPAAGTYTSGQSVTLSTSTSGASIRYTTDGSVPTPTSGTVYSGTLHCQRERYGQSRCLQDRLGQQRCSQRRVCNYRHRHESRIQYCDRDLCLHTMGHVERDAAGFHHSLHYRRQHAVHDIGNDLQRSHQR